MPFRMSQFFIAVCLYLAICIIASTAIEPFSIVNYVGPAAGVTGALILLWGASSLLAVLLGTILFNCFVYFYFDYQVELAITLISFLAITLQAFWTKQLTYKYVYNQQWLNSRALLFVFLAKIGPLAGLVSASATILVAVLDAKILAGSLIYAFFSSWAGSILTAVFITPSLLLTQGEQKLSFIKRFFVVIASAMGCIAISLLFVFSQKSNQHHRNDGFEDATTLITNSINQKASQIAFQVNALAALLSASDEVTEHEFRQFAQRVYLPESGIKALEWVPAVTQKNKASFEKMASEEHSFPYAIYEPSMMGDLIKASPRALYFPVLYIYPAENRRSIFGLDFITHPDKYAAMNQAKKTGEIVASAPITLVQDNFERPGSLIFFPIYNSGSALHFGEQRSSNFVISGYVSAVVQFDDFFQNLASTLQEQNIQFSILDNSNNAPYILYGQESVYQNRLVQKLTMDLFSRQWLISVSEIKPWDVQQKSWQTWGLLLGGTLGGIFFQILILMMAAYSTELSNQVMLKTRELILAKEQADQANFAKTKFLSTLALELKSPLLAVKTFLNSYRDKKLPEVSANAIGSVRNASQSMGHLVDHLQDLNSIESGKLTLNTNKVDLHDFVLQIEATLKNTARLRGQSVKVLLGKNVPQFVDVDEYRLRQLLTIITDNAFSLLQTDVLRVSIKAHLHKVASTSLFFVFSADETLISEQNNLYIFDDENSELESHSTAMTMVKELSQLLGGNAKVVHLPSGSSVISISILVQLPAVNQTVESQFEMDSITYKTLLTNKDVLLASCDEELVNEIGVLLNQVTRKFDVTYSQQSIFEVVHQHRYKLMIIDGDDVLIDAVHVAEQIRRDNKHNELVIIGLFSQQLSPEKLLTIKGTMNGYLQKPINVEKLKYYLSQTG
ncbi:CHASE domain-containing protein [Thalassotalea sp. PLHSN55]|uniref:sensor histidine kinase n=1 Tax=Thalassotalea sp. PLHSN55 TaxID=3435888 RepID=UPI003F857F9E